VNKYNKIKKKLTKIRKYLNQTTVITATPLKELYSHLLNQRSSKTLIFIAASVLTDTQILIELLKITEEKSQELVDTYAQKMKELQVYG
jgi:hypothetical protein